jgi:hypothetical protein
LKQLQLNLKQYLPNKLLHLTANSLAIFEMLCPILKQVVFQGSVPRSVGSS